MKIELQTKILSVNNAWQGRKFKTKEAKEYDERLGWLLLPYKKHKINAKYYEIHYVFYLKYFATTDYDNPIKPLQDCLVRAGLISDDRKIVRARIEKYPASEDRAEIEILEAEI